MERNYLSDMEYRQDYESLVYDDYVTNRALEQLNLEMHIEFSKVYHIKILIDNMVQL